MVTGIWPDRHMELSASDPAIPQKPLTETHERAVLEIVGADFGEPLAEGYYANGTEGYIVALAHLGSNGISGGSVFLQISVLDGRLFLKVREAQGIDVSTEQSLDPKDVLQKLEELMERFKGIEGFTYMPYELR